MKITITEDVGWQPPGLTPNGHVEVVCEQVADGVHDQDLKGWAFDELSGEVVGEPPSSAEVAAAAAAFDWPRVFKDGDVVRTRDGRTIGVVLVVADCGGGGEPHYELHVDTVTDGEREGVGIWEPWALQPASDAASLEEARWLGLRR